MKIIKNIFAVALAFLVLVSSTSFMVGMHFCMGEVQDISLFSKAEPCENERDLPPCHRKLDPCCEDEIFIHQSDDFQVKTADIPLSAPVAIDIEAPLVLVAEIIPSAPVSRTRYHNYDPPLRSHDLTVEHRVFLI